jgi:hypothetical protein
MTDMTPKERVFGTLKNLLKIVDSGTSLDADRARIKLALERCVSWESQLDNISDSDQVQRKAS